MSEPIIVITTGGTIDKQYFDALSKYEIGDSMVSKLLEVARVRYPYVVEESLRKDSIEMTDDDRAQIIEHVEKIRSKRVVITHGTDTITSTAESLSVISGKTIVLTGALTPARFSESDAPFNLGMAFATVQIAPAGVYIVINGSVFRGNEIVKDRELGHFAKK